jgi:hypothetical protein
MARTFDTPEALDDYVKEQLRGELAKLPLPCRKPDRFSHGASFRDYVAAWSNYADAIQIPEANRYTVLLTFLDAESQALANGLGLTTAQKAAWTDASKRLIEVLDQYTSASAMKKQFLKATQQSKESVTEYGTRISRLFKHAFEEAADDDLLCSVFLNGLRSDAIALQMTAYEPTAGANESRFHVLLRQAQELESAINSRLMDSAVSAKSEVLQVSSRSREGPLDGGPPTNVGMQSQPRPPQIHPGTTPHAINTGWRASNAVHPSLFNQGYSNSVNDHNALGQQLGPRTQFTNKYSGIIRCHFCNEVGHVVRNCPRRVTATERRPTASCYKCGSIGHLWRGCKLTTQSDIRAGFPLRNEQTGRNFSSFPPNPRSVSERYSSNNNSHFAPQRHVHFDRNRNQGSYFNPSAQQQAAEIVGSQPQSNASTVNFIDHQESDRLAWDDFTQYFQDQPDDPSSYIISEENLNC